MLGSLPVSHASVCTFIDTFYGGAQVGAGQTAKWQKAGWNG